MISRAIPVNFQSSANFTKKTHNIQWCIDIKEVFSDSNNIILWHELEDITPPPKKKSLFPKFQLIQILCCQVMDDYVWFIAPIDYCVE